MSASEPSGSNSHPASHCPSRPDENVPLVSVVVPCYNEEDVLGELYRRLSGAVDSWEEAAEIVLVDDGSTDTTWSKMEAIRRKDSRWRIVRFSRNFGHQTAVSAGLRYAAGGGRDRDGRGPSRSAGRTAPLHFQVEGRL
ncbi:glycosyltransferase [Salinibacter sp.]|uniref:glycosyltransferase n=1 Tax=Salinibacter sp. TaxID=2065818 RepID=UPI0023431B3E